MGLISCNVVSIKFHNKSCAFSTIKYSLTGPLLCKKLHKNHLESKSYPEFVVEFNYYNITENESTSLSCRDHEN